MSTSLHCTCLWKLLVLSFALAASASMAETDPHLQILDFDIAATNATMTWQGKKVKGYTVQRSLNLVSGDWAAVSDTSPTQDGVVMHSFPTTNTTAFYRLSSRLHDFPIGYWAHYDMPQLSDTQRIELAMEPLTNGPAYYSNIVQQAALISSNIENYVVDWLAGHEPAELPTNLLPYGITSEKTPSWTLVQPENINPTQQWYCVPAHSMDPEYQDCYMLGSELNITYLKLLYVAPFNSKLIVEGDFPHCRFMDFEIIQPFDPTHPTTGHKPEQPEVPLVDADIEPNPGHVNPFIVGADRTATQRQYRVTFELRGGNAVTLNPGVMGSEYYRDPSNSNTRVGGPFGFSGPYGSNVFVPGVLWIRYYAADHGAGPLAGVPIPRVIQELSTGEQFWIQPDLNIVEDRQTTTVPAGSSQPGPPYPFIGPSNGWFKIFGLVLIRYERDAYMDTYGTAATNVMAVKQYIRDLFWLYPNLSTL